jgi:hypothetical protein
MMNKILIVFLETLPVFIAWYFVFAFVANSLNPMDWNFLTRLFYVIVLFLSVKPQ